MEWTRSKGEVCEYSTGYVGLCNYISMSHTTYNNHYWYTYSVDGEEMFHGSFNAKNWDEAEQIAVDRIREELSYRAERWKKMLEDFNGGVSASGT